MHLSAHSLACRRAGRRVFSGVTFDLGPGEALAVTGRNGAGKSSLLAILAGLLRPDAGTVAAAGTGERALPECLHLLAHRDALKSSLTVRENLADAAAILGEAGLSPDLALARLGLVRAASLPVGSLSAGQRRRVALARLLVARRPLWLLDEPTTALDGESRGRLGTLMEDHLAAGGLIVAATHGELPIRFARELRLDTPGREAVDAA